MKHHRSIIALHWFTAVLVAIVFSAILYREGLDDGDQRKFWLDLHRSFGLSILALVVLRVIARLRFGREPVVVTTPLLHRVSALGQAALYVAMLALPLLGWAQSSARAHRFKLFDIPLPSLIAHDPERADQIAEWHEALAWAFLALILGHFVAALYHHFVRKDGVLRSMLPGRKS